MMKKRMVVAHKKNLNRKVDVDVGCIIEYYLMLLRKIVLVIGWLLKLF